MVYSDTDGELLAEHNIVKANPEDDVFQNMAYLRKRLKISTILSPGYI